MIQQYKKSGFTLIETILAVTVIALVITAAAQLTQGSLRSGRSTMSQFIAYHLAEEGLETVRNIRDSNWLQNRPWRHGFADDGTYLVANGLPRHLEIMGDTGSAEKIALNQTEQFERALKIASLQTGIRVISTVKYENNGQPGEISLVAELTDWKKGPL